MVVVTTRAMRMPVLDLFVGGVSQRLDSHLEMQGLPGQRMIRIDRDGLLRETGDEKRNLAPFVVVSDHLHSRGELRAFGCRGAGLGDDHVERRRAAAAILLVIVVDQVLIIGEGVDRLDVAGDDAELVVDDLQDGECFSNQGCDLRMVGRILLDVGLLTSC